MSAAREFDSDFSRPIFRVGEILKIEAFHIITKILKVYLFICVEFETIKGTICEKQFARVFIYE